MIVKQKWIGRGDAGELYLSLPWWFRGYDPIYMIENVRRQPILVVGARPGKLYCAWGSNCEGPLVQAHNTRLRDMALVIR